MKNNYKLLLAIITSVLSLNVNAQFVSNFEDITLAPNSYNKGQDWKKGFNSGGAIYSNEYDSAFGGYWSGFAISNLKDTLAEGYKNEGNAITGSGYDNSNNYGVAYSYGHIKVNKDVMGFYITNNTYAYYNMKKGDSFTRKFGDTTGTKSSLAQGSYPDYLMVSFKGFKNGIKKDSVVNFYLADYRFADNSKDYIIKNWRWVDLSKIGSFDSLTFSFASSDTFGGFGINTPTYFCIDNLTYSIKQSLEEKLSSKDVSIFPNPAANQLFIDLPKNIKSFECIVSDINGKEIMRESNSNSMDVSELNSGLYFISIKTDMGDVSKKFVVRAY
jgi:hypothetical protein